MWESRLTHTTVSSGQRSFACVSVACCPAPVGAALVCVLGEFVAGGAAVVVEGRVGAAVVVGAVVGAACGESWPLRQELMNVRRSAPDNFCARALALQSVIF